VYIFIYIYIYVCISEWDATRWCLSQQSWLEKTRSMWSPFVVHQVGIMIKWWNDSKRSYSPSISKLHILYIYIYTQQKEQGSSTSTVESISPRAIQLHRMKGRQYTYYDGANDVKKGVITNLK